MALLKISNVYKSFQGDLNVLSDSSLEVQANEIVSLVGPSGSGKSTFLMIAGLLDTADSGKIIVDGVDCSSLNDAERTSIRGENIGFIYQFHHLLPEFSAIENLILPQIINKVSYDIAVAKAIEILDKLGLKDRAKHLPSELSGGEQQRVAVARSMINQPKLILADEPTGNLDPENAQKVMELLVKEVKSRNMAAVIVTHNMDLSAKTDRVVTIKQGKIVEINS